jgi:hypothetical protein
MTLGRLYGLPLEKINRLACKVAAYVCSQAGATPTFPAELLAELKREMTIPIREIPGTVPAAGMQKCDLHKTN